MKLKLLALVACAPLGLMACGGDSASPDLAVAVAHDLSTLATGVEGCAAADFIDATTDVAARTISPWNPTLGRKCVHIKIGQTITWSPPPSSTHPLEATGGTTPNPITLSNTVTFPNAGTFGYDCGVHHGLMHGAILVD